MAKNAGQVVVILAVSMVIIGGVAAWGVSKYAKANDPVETYPSQGNEHVLSPSDPHPPYNSSPPTSGAHIPQMARPGLFLKPVPPEILVHNLEDGDVVIYYQPGIKEHVRERLLQLVERHSTGNNAVLAVPSEDLSHPLVLTAWTKILRLNTYDRSQVDGFIRRYLGLDHHVD